MRRLTRNGDWGFGWKKWSRQKLYDRLGLNTGSSICRKRSRFERPHNP